MAIETDHTLVTKIMTFVWEEPQTGAQSFTARLLPEEWKIVEGVITWLREAAEEQGEGLGGALAEWYFFDTNAYGGDYSTLQEVLEEVKTESRYEEDPDLYGESRNDVLEALVVEPSEDCLNDGLQVRVMFKECP